jgi:hypothetical protein
MEVFAMPKKDLNQIAANIAALTTRTKIKDEAPSVRGTGRNPPRDERALADGCRD